MFRQHISCCVSSHAESEDTNYHNTENILKIVKKPQKIWNKKNAVGVCPEIMAGFSKSKFNEILVDMEAQKIY